MREDNEEVKHECKFCDKSFPSGRQLGGHMRSHQNHINSVDANGVGNNKKRRRRRREGINSGENSEVRAGLGAGEGSRTAYVLRENPRKSWRLAAKDAWSDRDKSCRECGIGFGSWKALFGHMKRHALEDRDSRTGNDQRTVLVDEWEHSRLDDEDEEEVAVPSRRRRTERRKRYMVAAASSSSLSLVNIKNNVNDDGNHNVVSSASVIDQEQEEVAMCLMMLSRDVGHRKAMDSIIPKSSDAKRSLLDAERGGSIIGNSRSDNLEVENEVQFQSRVILTDFGSAKDSNSVQGSCIDPVAVKVSKTISRKTSLSSDLNDSELRMKTQNEFEDNEGGFGLFSGMNSDKRSRFECITCNKAFHSYQALGGHKASHSKIKNCFDGNINGETKISPPAKARKMIEKNGVVGKKHECPICLKVFPSGQALGGHKRSHMQPGVAAEGAKMVNPSVTVRDVFDLNLPAQIEAEGSSHVTCNSGCSQSHEEAF